MPYTFKANASGRHVQHYGLVGRLAVGDNYRLSVVGIKCQDFHAAL